LQLKICVVLFELSDDNNRDKDYYYCLLSSSFNINVLALTPYGQLHGQEKIYEIKTHELN